MLNLADGLDPQVDPSRSPRSIAISFIGATPARAASTRAEYIEQADPICAQTLADVMAIQPSFNKAFYKHRYKLAARKLRSEITLYETMVVNLAALQPPPADSVLIDSWLNAQRDLNSLATRRAKVLAHRKLKRSQSSRCRA